MKRIPSPNVIMPSQARVPEGEELAARQAEFDELLRREQNETNGQ